MAEGDRVYVAGGANKNVFVYDLDGEPIAIVTSDSAAFLNDLTIVEGQGIHHRQSGPNLNGIRPGPEGTLVTTNFATGKLYTIDLETGEVTQVELTGGELVNGDGFVGEGDTLWLVRGTSPVVTKVEFKSPEAATITIGEPDESLGFPTTGAFDADDNLWVVNFQFDKGGTKGEGSPGLPFTISTTPIP